MESNLKVWNLVIILILVLAICIILFNKEKKLIQEDLLETKEQNIILMKIIIELGKQNQNLKNQTIWEKMSLGLGRKG